MIVKKITYNNGKNEGYFVETRKGYIQIIIRNEEVLKLNAIKKISEVRINKETLKIEDEERYESYIR